MIYFLKIFPRNGEGILKRMRGKETIDRRRTPFVSSYGHGQE
jgi:hypothetical protein